MTSQERDQEDRLVEALVGYLHEAAEEKRRGREGRKNSGFWAWLRENSTALVGLVTALSIVVGAAWTVKTYTDAEAARRDAEKNASIREYVAAVGDPGTRNSAVINFAILREGEAVPFLIEQVRYAAENPEQNRIFLRSLSQALVITGDAGIEPLVRVHREVFGGVKIYGSNFETGLTDVQTAILETTQPAIEYALKNLPEAHEPAWLDFSNVLLRNVDLRHADLDGLNFGGAQFVDSDLCSVTLRNTDLSGARFVGVRMSEADLTGASIDGARFVANTDLISAILDGVRGEDAFFNSNSVYHAFMRGAQLRNASLRRSRLVQSDFSNTDLAKADLSFADLFLARFTGADLSFAQLTHADVGQADFSNANLEQASFFSAPEDLPVDPDEEKRGAFVLGARFTGATNVSDDLRRYLCRWGALDVPGGCADAPREQVAELIRGGLAAGLCFISSR
jgi:uncharacterized protein YjbI with pentapeptide repeats